MRSKLTPEEKKKIRERTALRKKLRPKPRPIWKRSDIDESKEYVLLLLESDSGFREFELREVSKKNDAVEGSKCIYMTDIVPMVLILSRNIDKISESVKLQNGSGFGFDSNARWMTEKEIEEFERSFDR